jgi:type VI protein secretion system component VasK
MLAPNEYAIAVVKGVAAADGDDKTTVAALEQIRKNLEVRMQDELIEQYMRHLAGKYPVEINQAALDAFTKNDGE